jgi:hypothetical protein
MRPAEHGRKRAGVNGSTDPCPFDDTQFANEVKQVALAVGPGELGMGSLVELPFCKAPVCRLRRAEIDIPACLPWKLGTYEYNTYSNSPPVHVWTEIHTTTSYVPTRAAGSKSDKSDEMAPVFHCRWPTSTALQRLPGCNSDITRDYYYLVVWLPWMPRSGAARQCDLNPPPRLDCPHQRAY